MENIDKTIVSRYDEIYSYYKSNPFKCINDYMGIELKYHQKLLIKFYYKLDSIKNKIVEIKRNRRTRGLIK